MDLDQKKLLQAFLDRLSCRAHVWVTEHYYPGVGLLEVAAYTAPTAERPCLPLYYLDSLAIAHAPNRNHVAEARTICAAHLIVETVL